MSPRLPRRLLTDGSIIDVSIESISPDRWRPHGVRYRFAWVQSGVARVVFDNHTGKSDHFHIDGVEFNYEFKGMEQLRRDFEAQILKLGGVL